jgi:hypothetical protein
MKTTEITIETERIISVSRHYRAVEMWCDGCDAQTMMIRPDQAAEVAGCTLRALFRAIEAGNLHFTETPTGMVLICLASLLQMAASINA